MGFEDKVNRLAERAAENSRWRRTKTVNLIPSENAPSPIVEMLTITDPAGRYAEHRDDEFYYQGIDFIRDVEANLITELKSFFGATDVEPRPISGTQSNEIVYQGIVRHLKRRMKSVLTNGLNNGGHLTHQPLGALFNLVENGNDGKPNIHSIPVLPNNPYSADTQKLSDKIGESRPELIILGKSMFLSPEPIAEVKRIANSIGPGYNPVIMFDMAHVLGLYGSFQSPLQEGAHILTGSTHKTFFGTQRGVIAGNIGEETMALWKSIVTRTFPGSTSNHHLGTLLGNLMAAYEMNEFKDSYQTQVMSNAKAFARALNAHGIKVEGESPDYTSTHQVVINVREYGNGKEIAARLENSNIITNYQALPYDKSFSDPSGIRTGVQEMTRFGMKEKDFAELAGYIADVIIHDRNVKLQIEHLRNKFLVMQYCLQAEKAAPIAAQILYNAMPDSNYARMFANNLNKLAKQG